MKTKIAKINHKIKTYVNRKEYYAAFVEREKANYALDILGLAIGRNIK